MIPVLSRVLFPTQFLRGLEQLGAFSFVLIRRASPLLNLSCAVRPWMAALLRLCKNGSDDLVGDAAVLPRRRFHSNVIPHGRARPRGIVRCRCIGCGVDGNRMCAADSGYVPIYCNLDSKERKVPLPPANRACSEWQRFRHGWSRAL